MGNLLVGLLMVGLSNALLIKQNHDLKATRILSGLLMQFEQRDIGSVWESDALALYL